MNYLVTNIVSARYTGTPGQISLVVEAAIDGKNETIPFSYVPGDPYGLSPAVEKWLEDHPDLVIEPVVVEQPTPANITLTRRQVRRAIAYSVGLDAVTAAIMALPAGQVRDLALVDWEDSPVYLRSHPLFDQLSVAIGITPAEIDALWIWAAGFDA